MQLQAAEPVLPFVKRYDSLLLRRDFRTTGAPALRERFSLTKMNPFRYRHID